MCLEDLFNDQRLVSFGILIWSVLSAVVFGGIMIADHSPFLHFGPSTETELFGVKLDTWWEWWAVAIYTFMSTAIAAFATDSVVPWITNTVQDHKNRYLPYGKFTCWIIIQVFTFYAVTQSVIGLFVALTQVDFMLIRLLADMLVNHFTTFWFLRHKSVDTVKYKQYINAQDNADSLSDKDLELDDGTNLGDLELSERSALRQTEP